MVGVVTVAPKSRIRFFILKETLVQRSGDLPGVWRSALWKKIYIFKQLKTIKPNEEMNKPGIECKDAH